VTNNNSIAADSGNATRLVKVAERDAASAIDELKEARRSDDVANRKKLIVSATARFEASIAALKQIATSEG